VLPDLGGHLYGCTDKRNGQQMFYANPSIKLAAIAYRGAWAGVRRRVQLPGVAQLDDGVAGGLRDEHRGGRQRFGMGRQTSIGRTACSGACS